jgi:hypothetical protein
MNEKEIRRFQCSTSFTYNCKNPAEAAQEFIDNLAAVPIWFIEVQEVGTENRYVVDTQTNEIEAVDGEEPAQLEVYLLLDDIDRIPAEQVHPNSNHFDANGKSYGVGVFWIDGDELIERHYGPTEEIAFQRARSFVIRSGYIETERED